MSQKTLYKEDCLRVVEERLGETLGDVIWIADGLDEMEVSLDADQVEAVLPVLTRWLLARKSIREPIRVWKFDDAPEEYRSLSPHGGDEDWLAFIPSDFSDQEPYWMEEGSRFGCFSVSRSEVEGGTVVIGAHS